MAPKDLEVTDSDTYSGSDLGAPTEDLGGFQAGEVSQHDEGPIARMARKATPGWIRRTATPPTADSPDDERLSPTIAVGIAIGLLLTVLGVGAVLYALSGGDDQVATPAEQEEDDDYQGLKVKKGFQ